MKIIGKLLSLSVLALSAAYLIDKGVNIAYNKAMDKYVTFDNDNSNISHDEDKDANY